jgi:hypothetical protein
MHRNNNFPMDLELGVVLSNHKCVPLKEEELHLHACQAEKQTSNLTLESWDRFCHK